MSLIQLRPTALGALLFVAGISLSMEAAARCAYYAGYGYRCFGEEGGTGGKAFEEMDENTKKCGYFNPGCLKRPEDKKQALESNEHDAEPPRSDQAWTPPQSDEARTPPQSDGGWSPPKSDGDYRRPEVGPGYQAPGTNR